MEGIIRLHEAHLAGVPPRTSARAWRRELERHARATSPSARAPTWRRSTVERERIREACEYARDELGFDMCVDVVATDYLEWGGKGVSGYIGTATGRDLNHPATQGLQVLPRREAEALLDQLPPPRPAAGRAARAAAVLGSTTARRCRASSPSGRPATGTSASSSTSWASSSTATRTSSGCSCPRTGKGIRCARTTRSAASPSASRTPK